ncbi:MAG TPA: hypothetical protein VFM68_02965 [Candidatus Saccharimonadales bacterium]|nr:hypothetical protein [Candidatus Saccharimonadales bacterium]
MTERFTYRNKEPLPPTAPIRTLDEDLRVLSDECALVMAYQRYIKDELGISEEEADALFLLLQSEGTLPSSEAFDSDELLNGIKEEYRLGIFSGIEPLYRNMHTSEEYEEWLPAALNVVVPKDGRHQPDDCLRTNGIIHGCCEIGTCPVHIVIDSAKESLESSDFTSYEYQTDSEKACRDSLTLLSELVDRHYIPLFEANRLKYGYINTYNQTFSKSE